MSSRKEYRIRSRSRSPQKSRTPSNSNRSNGKALKERDNHWDRDRGRSDRDRRPTHERERYWQGQPRDRQWQRDRYRSRSPQRYRYVEIDENKHYFPAEQKRRTRSREKVRDRSREKFREKSRDKSREKVKDRKTDRDLIKEDRDHRNVRKPEKHQDNKKEDRKPRKKSSRKRDSSKTKSRSRKSHSPHSQSDSSGGDGDQEGIVIVRTGDYIRERYKVIGYAGQGTFGTVLDVLDTKHEERIALKVVRSVKRYLEAAYVEMDILEKIRQADPEKKSGCVRLYCTFETKHRGQRHVCLGFEKLGRSLYEFIKKNKYRGFSLEHVRRFGYQLINSVAFCHSINLIHTDLKPENILLCEDSYEMREKDGDKDYRVPLRTDIRLIDFGGATFEKDHHSRIINTRQYRSPEVLLGLGWSYPSDMWSVGCILAELLTGELLFATHEDLEHLALMEKMLGQPLPLSMTREALKLSPSSSSSKRDDDTQSRSAKRSRSRSSEKRKRARSSSNPRPDLLLNTETARLKWPDAASGRPSIKHVQKAKALENLFPDANFVDLLRKCLAYEPKARITATDALKHPFFGGSTSSSSSSSSRDRSRDRRSHRNETGE